MAHCRRPATGSAEHERAARMSLSRSFAAVWRRVALPLAALVLITLGVEAAVRIGHVRAYQVPAPSAVLSELARQPGLFLSHSLATVTEAAIGLLVAGVFALAFAAAAVHSRTLDRLLSPLVVISQTIPVIALAPLLVLWFGYGTLPRVVVCALIAFFPMAVTALQGFRTVDGQLLLLMRSVNASRWDVFWRIRFPGAAPFLTAGLRTGATLSLVGAVVAEWTGSDKGLGYLVLSANARLATAQAFAAVLLISILGLAAYGGSLAVESHFSWWQRGTSIDPQKGT
jgi:ABC-type nitrate/sulfonate/bicarbonate transport system permease component